MARGSLLIDCTIGLLCSGVGSNDKANITNIFVKCGLMRSVPKRISPGSPMLFEAGSKWSQQVSTANNLEAGDEESKAIYGLCYPILKASNMSRKWRS